MVDDGRTSQAGKGQSHLRYPLNYPKRITLDLTVDDHHALLGARYTDRVPMAAGVDTTTTTRTIGQARQTVARAFGTPQLQALFSGPGDGRSRDQQTWQQHRAGVTATAVPVVDDNHPTSTRSPAPGSPFLTQRSPSRSPAPPAARTRGRPPRRPTGSTA